MAKVSTRTTRAPKGANHTNSIAALRYLAAACGQTREIALGDEEAYGLEVLLNMIADSVEGGAA